MSNSFFQKDIVSVRDFDKQKFETVFQATDKIIEMNPNERRELVRGKTLGYLFFEPSTRTRLSFEAAMASIGGASLGISDASSSSAKKGESLADTVKIMSLYSDVLILRHQLDGSSRFAAEISEKPLINAGSGTEEHPTQAILDLYTIRKEKKKIDGLKIGIVGDLKYGRTVYSLLYALSNYNVDVKLISPPSLKIRADSTYEIRKKLQNHPLQIELLAQIELQLERFSEYASRTNQSDISIRYQSILPIIRNIRNSKKDIEKSLETQSREMRMFSDIEKSLNLNLPSTISTE